MRIRACLSLALLVVIPVWSQVVPAATGSTEILDDAYRMPIPPLVSGKAFPTTTLSEERSNYLNAGLAFEPAYYDNLLVGYGTQPTSDMAYSIRPSIALDQLTSRLHQTWTYNPSFTFYQRTSARNAEDQSASLDFQFRLNQHTTINVTDMFQKSSNVFNVTTSSLASSSSSAEVIPPLVNRTNNTTIAEITHQYSRNDMIGAGGTYGLNNYPDKTEFPNLYDWNSRGGSAFYERRLFGTHFIGITYQYGRVLGYPTNGELEIQTHSTYFSYTANLTHGISLFLAAGPQYFNMDLSPLPSSGSWTPAAMANIGKKGEHTNISASYSRSVSGGGGLLGAFSSSSAKASARWQMTRTWTADMTGSYVLFENVSPQSLSTEPNRRSISGTASIEHSLGGHFTASLEYQRIHQSYNGLAGVNSNPDSDREAISIIYHFTRPLGR